MDKPIIAKANPFVSVSPTPMNTTLRYNDSDYDETVPPIYRGFINDRNLKLSFTVIWNNHFELESQEDKPEFKQYREFQVVKFDNLHLHGLDRGKQPDPDERSGTISANSELVQALYSNVLSPYGIVLNKVNMHDYKDFESIDFTFSDEQIKNQIMDLIDYTFRKKLT